MFRDRMLHWATILDNFTCAMETTVILARTRLGSLLFADILHRPATTHRPNVNPKIDMAVAYMQVSKLNR